MQKKKINGKKPPLDYKHKNDTTRQTWQTLKFRVKMLYINIRLKAITKAKVNKFPVQSFTLENILHSKLDKKAGAALVRTISGNNTRK